MKFEKIFFNPAEVRAIALGLGRVLEDLNSRDMKLSALDTGKPEDPKGHSCKTL